MTLPGPETQLFGIVAHELRSPIAAILGYEELLSEGLLGQVDDRAREALARIRSSARQLLTLTEGMQELSGRDAPRPVAEPLDHAALLRGMCERATAEAEARRVTIDVGHVPDEPVPGTGDPQLIDVMLDAACGAALKTSAGRSIQPTVTPDEARIVYRLAHTGVDAGLLGQSAIASGAALRLRIAHGFATRVGGSLRVLPEPDDAGTTIEIVLPRAASASPPEPSAP